MKDNIQQEIINNRKIILEIRNTPNLQMLDKKGAILDDLTNLNIFKTEEWASSDTGVKITDQQNEKEERQTIYFDLHRITYITSKISSIDKFYNEIKKIFEVYKKYSEKSEVIRIGCRVIGTYNSKSNNFTDLVKNFEKAFPSSVFLEDFPVTDLKLTLKYETGIYEIGPVQENDAFILKNFRFNEKISKMGFGIDTDNHILKGTASIKNLSKIQDVLTASLAVEKALVDKLREF